ncbi:cytochrome c4 [Lysobacter sp. TY2-98]|uniref:c-type cytochrome n=1 Tax=Lysobacter sp. TY2-98 TaxID=2290922 RepID=UPI000E1FDFCB|nr:cytochrome c4 [Lysobacter sp. TY2-98]AXK70836.1 cytochrome c4 [Lysobacter sp. TY2-98]
MRHARVYGLVGLAALAVAAAAVAQTTVTPVPDKAPVQVAPLASETATWGDPKKGQQKAGACAACHGLDGNPSAPTYPRLAGMPERYVAKQLELFKTHQRTTGMAAVMYPIAEPLSAQDMRDLGAWFQTQKAGAGISDDTAVATGPNAGKKYYELGQTLFRGGDKARGIPACMACHGAAGQGNPGPAYPALAGQQADYAKRRLEEYRAGTAPAATGAPATAPDKNFHIMATIASKLTDEEIGSLASYVQGLHNRANDAGAKVSNAPVAAPAPAGAAPAAAPAATPAQPAAPAAATPTQG